MIEPGDIILIERGTGWQIVAPLIRLFTWIWWKGEKIPRVYHAELALAGEKDLYMALSAQPPAVQVVTRRLREVKVLVFRLRAKMPNMKKELDHFVEKEKGKPYDFPTFIMYGLNWMFHTKLFSEMLRMGYFRYCAELVAQFYDGQLWIPCSEYSPQSTSPDDILDYCESSSDFFQVNPVA